MIAMVRQKAGSSTDFLATAGGAAATKLNKNKRRKKLKTVKLQQS